VHHNMSTIKIDMSYYYIITGSSIIYYPLPIRLNDVYIIQTEWEKNKKRLIIIIQIMFLNIVTSYVID